jgi:hypothetical protein
MLTCAREKVRTARNELKRNTAYLLLLTLIRQDGTAVDDETVWRRLVVELETLLSRGDGGKDRETVDTRLDVRGGTVLLRKHRLEGGDLCAVDRRRGCEKRRTGGKRRGEEADRGGAMSEIMEVPVVEADQYWKAGKQERQERTSSASSLQTLD